MLNNFHSVLNKSFVKRASFLNTSQIQNSKKSLAEALMLTSLIDAFSILVVYLLMSFSSAGEMNYMNTDVDLPKAVTLERLDRYSIVRITKKDYFLEDEKISSQKMVPVLIDLKRKLVQKYGDVSEMSETITVQADKSIKFSRLSSVIQACGHAGFSDIKFAVLGD